MGAASPEPIDLTLLLIRGQQAVAEARRLHALNLEWQSRVAATIDAMIYREVAFRRRVGLFSAPPGSSGHGPPDHFRWPKIRIPDPDAVATCPEGRR